MELYIKRLEDNKVFKVWKYINNGTDPISIWCNDWYGHHVIGQDCEFVWVNKQMVNSEYIKEDGTPLKCTKCKSTKFITNVVSQLEHETTEMEMICTECGQVNGHWSCGLWIV